MSSLSDRLLVNQHRFKFGNEIKAKEYVRQILEKIHYPARHVIANIPIKHPRDILVALAEVYKEYICLTQVFERINGSDQYVDENLEFFMRRLGALVETGIKRAKSEFGEGKTAETEKLLHRTAINRFNAFATAEPDVLTAVRLKEPQTIYDVLEVFRDLRNKLQKSITPVRKILRPTAGSEYQRPPPAQYNIPYQNNSYHQPNNYYSYNRPQSPRMNYTSPRAQRRSYEPRQNWDGDYYSAQLPWRGQQIMDEGSPARVPHARSSDPVASGSEVLISKINATLPSAEEFQQLRKEVDKINSHVNKEIASMQNKFDKLEVTISKNQDEVKSLFAEIASQFKDRPRVSYSDRPRYKERDRSSSPASRDRGRSPYRDQTSSDITSQPKTVADLNEKLARRADATPSNPEQRHAFTSSTSRRY